MALAVVRPLNEHALRQLVTGTSSKTPAAAKVGHSSQKPSQRPRKVVALATAVALYFAVHRLLGPLRHVAVAIIAASAAASAAWLEPQALPSEPPWRFGHVEMPSLVVLQVCGVCYVNFSTQVCMCVCTCAYAYFMCTAAAIKATTVAWS